MWLRGAVSPPTWLSDALRAFVVVARQRSLARAELAFGATVTADWAFTIGLGIVAFQDGGASRVGLVAALRLLPSAVLAPVAAAMADRLPRERVLASSSTLLAASSAAGALTLAVSGPLLIVYLLAAVSTIALTPYRAAHSALLPSLCQTTEELATSNVVRGLVESVAVIVGPLGAAALMGLGPLWSVFAATAGVALTAAALVTRLPYEAPPRLVDTQRTRVRDDVAEGLRASAANREALTLILVTATQTFLRGALTVFAVVLAIEVLDRGEPGVGLLQGAIGIGAVAGSVAATRLVGTTRMAAWFGLSVALWGLPISLIGVHPRFTLAIALLAVVGVANALLDATLFTMLARLVPDEVLARVFGTFEMVVATSVAVGSVAAAAAIDLVGTQAAMVLLGAVAPVTVALTWPRLRRIDALLGARNAELAILQQVPMLRLLPVPTIEHLARHLRRRIVAGGAAVIRRGTVGSAYYVVASGTVEVHKDGQIVRRMGPGEGFGEISLLRGMRRSRTVRTCPGDAVELYVIGRDDFVRAVGGYSLSATEATATIDRWSRPSDA